jgi:hypothetical protein
VDEWIRIPRRVEDEQITGQTIVSAGRDLLVFGGARWEDGLEATLLDEAWVWSP